MLIFLNCHLLVTVLRAIESRYMYVDQEKRTHFKIQETEPDTKSTHTEH